MPESDPKNIADAIAAFRAAADAKGDGDSLPARKDHALHAQMAKAVWALDDLGQDGFTALEGLTRDTSPHVRSWAAAELLSRGHVTAVPILEEIARQSGMRAFNARMVLQQFQKGDLGSPFGKRGGGPSNSIDRIPSVLEQAVPAYHAAVERGDVSSEQAELRWICVAMAGLLSRRLQYDERWSTWRVVHDVLPHGVVTHTPAECTVRGLALWSEDGGMSYSDEPFVGTVRLGAPGDRIQYAFQFGDAAMGLGRLTRKERLKSEAGLHHPREWLFSFSTADETGRR